MTFRPGAIWPDNNGVHINAHGGGILPHDGVYYWFGEHKIPGEAGNRAHVGVHVYASRNLCEWRDEGIALAVSDDPASDIATGCILERPKVIYNPRTRQFVMWFHLELQGMGYNAARSGVAVSERAVGPYRFLGSFRPNAGVWPMNAPELLRKPLTAEEHLRLERVQMPGGPVPEFPKDLVFRQHLAGGQMARDMTLFVDDDGSAYHIYASENNGTLHISRLADDFLSPSGQYVRVFPGAFNEAPAMMKWRGRYFLFTSGCTGWSPNPARLAAADSIWGPWQELGNPCRGPAEEIATTFDSQSTHILPVAGLRDAYIFMADRWRPTDAIDGRYVWLPVRLDGGEPAIRWTDEWNLAAG